MTPALAFAEPTRTLGNVESAAAMFFKSAQSAWEEGDLECAQALLEKSAELAAQDSDGLPQASFEALCKHLCREDLIPTVAVFTTSPLPAVGVPKP